MNNTSSMASRPMTADELKVAELPWSELTTEQKVERLVMVLRSHEWPLSRLDAMTQDIHMLKNHHHGPAGQMLIPINNANASSGLGGLASGPKSPLNSLY